MQGQHVERPFAVEEKSFGTEEAAAMDLSWGFLSALQTVLK